MKKLLTIAFVFLSLFFAACEDEISISGSDMENINFYDDELIQDVTSILDASFKSESESDDIRDISLIIFSKIDYKAEKSGNYWQTPEETWNKKSGDCEDISMLIAYCCKQILNVEPDIVRVKKNGGNHIIIHYNGVYYDYGTMFLEKDLDILAVANYKYALAVAKKYHTSPF